MHGITISKVRAQLSSLCIICSLGQVKFSLYKYIMSIYFPWASMKFCYLHKIFVPFVLLNNEGQLRQHRLNFRTLALHIGQHRSLKEDKCMGTKHRFR